MTKPKLNPLPPYRPTKFTQPLAEEICRQLEAGQSLLDVCAQDDMPDRVTVVRWTKQDPAFASQLYAARQTQADLMDDLVLAIAKDVKPETANADAVRLKALTWRAARLNARRYGEKTSQEVTQHHQVTHIHLIAPDEEESVMLDGDFSLLPHPLEQE
jgi:hypothetical protein